MRFSYFCPHSFCVSYVSVNHCHVQLKCTANHFQSMTVTLWKMTKVKKSLSQHLKKCNLPDFRSSIVCFFSFYFKQLQPKCGCHPWMNDRVNMFWPSYHTLIFIITALSIDQKQRCIGDAALYGNSYGKTPTLDQTVNLTLILL